MDIFQELRTRKLSNATTKQLRNLERKNNPKPKDKNNLIN